MSDSAGIFIIIKRASIQLHVGLDSLHAGDPSGIGWDSGGIVFLCKCDVWPPNSGPGQTSATYLSKSASYVENVGPSLVPSYKEEELQAAVAGKGNTKGDEKGKASAVAEGKGLGHVRPHLKIREKRLDPELWKFQGEHRRGAHFPLCAYTNNVGRRSEAAFIARKEKRSWKKSGWKTASPAEDVKSEADQTWPAWPSSSSSTGWRY